MGGQSAKDENWVIIWSIYEYVASTGSWIERSSLSMECVSWSLNFCNNIPYKSCGIIIANGAVDRDITSDIICYYSIATNTWTKIGNMSQTTRMAVCDIYKDYLYCQSGNDGMFFSTHMQMGVNVVVN